VLTVGAVRDPAGNLVAPIGSWVASDRPGPTVTLRATPSLIDSGTPAMLSGRLTAPTGVSTLSLEARPEGGLLTIVLGPIPVAPDGTFSTHVAPSSSTEYKVRVPAVGAFGAGSVSAVVSVKRAVRLSWSSSLVQAGRVGAHVSIVASISPADSGVAVSFRLERWSTVSRSWQLVGTLNRRTGTSGRASVAWVPSGSALYRWRATAGWEPDYSTGSSSWVRWSIGR
jgi:hypothetical protein